MTARPEPGPQLHGRPLASPNNSNGSIEPTSRPIRWKITAALFGAQVSYSAASIASFTVASIVGAELGGSPVFAGVPAAMLYAGRAASAYPIGIIMDRAGRRPAIAAGYLAGVFGGVLAALAIVVESYALFVVAALIYGMARGGSDQSRFVAAEVHAEVRRGRIIGLIVFSGTIGAMIGPLLVWLSKRFAENAGLNWLTGPWIVAAVLSLLSMAIVLGLVRPDPLQILRSSGAAGRLTREPSRPRGSHPLAKMLHSPRIRLAISSMMVGQVVMAMIMSMAPLHMNEIGQDILAISFAMMSHTFGMFGLAWVTGWLVDRFGQIPVIAAGAIVLVTAGLLATAAEDVGVIIVVMFLLGLGWNFAFVAGSSLLVEGLAPGERGRTQGFGDALVSIAAGTGGLGSGLIFAWGGLEFLGWISLALASALLVSAFWVGVLRRSPAVAASSP